ncbi:hypothetical protein ACIRQT_07135 [Streptomyces californicus]
MITYLTVALALVSVLGAASATRDARKAGQARRATAGLLAARRRRSIR